MADVKPTPTQAENDKVAMGEHLAEHEPDGSDIDPTSPSELAKKSKQATAGEKAGYQTRQTKPAS